MNSIVLVVLIIGAAIWLISSNQEKKRLEEKKELERQQLEYQEKEILKYQEKKTPEECLNQEMFKAKKLLQERQEENEANIRKKKIIEEEQKQIKQKNSHQEQSVVESKDVIRVNFHFNYFYEDELKAIIVVFNEKTDWLDYKTIMRNSEEYSKKLYHYLRDNSKEMKRQLGLTEDVDIYLLPKFSTSSHLQEVSEWILSQKSQVLNQSLVKINSNGDLVGGEVKKVLNPDVALARTDDQSELSQLMNVLDYFVQSDVIIVYFKNEAACQQVLEKITDSFQAAANFCGLMIQMKSKFEEIELFETPISLCLMPISTHSSNEAAEMMNLMLTENDNILKKFLVVIDKQNQVTEGALVRNIPEDMLAKINKRQGLRSESRLNVKMDLEDSCDQNQEKSDNFNVYEWFIQETGEIFFVGVGYGNRRPLVKQNDLFKRVREKYQTDYRFTGKQLSKRAANKLKLGTIKKDLDAGNVLTNIQVPIGYAGGMSTSAEKTGFGARQYSYLKAPQIIGNIVETHYQLLESAETYDKIESQYLKKICVPTYALNAEKSLYFKSKSGNTAKLIERLKTEIKERTDAKIYKSLAKSADSVILTNAPRPTHVKDLHDRGYKVFHMIDVARFLEIDLEQVTREFE
ncbi:hypothetical protein [Levilactobacillus yiduensis]|uniref:hypothetical protein n=1 Tax=Levilactobacillus yiduensis TaxID=2953880 RepID=UPI000EF332AF|nr:hypothetical protein [Levilactobacillus yiduensis]AYM02241.1 hypothetical protein D8911_04250 [Levilactobacillus brevis]